MSHPYKKEADSTSRSKASNMGATTNLDKASTRAATGGHAPQSSSSSMQHKSQSAASGMKVGGKVGKRGKKSKPKLDISALIASAPQDTAPPSPSPGGMQAGAGPSPAPAPNPMMQKRGGKVQKKADGGEIEKASDALPNPFDEVKGTKKPIKVPKGPTVPPKNVFARGGGVKYPLNKGGADSGVGRLEKAKAYK